MEDLQPPTSPGLESEKVSSAEDIDFEDLYVDSKHSEYVVVNTETKAQILELLDSQKDVIKNDDIEALFLASEKVAGANCHKTSLFLTNKYSKEQLFSPDNDHPSTAGHEYVESHSKLYPTFSDLSSLVASKIPPFRISFFKDENGKPLADHSITILGNSNKGTLIGFEKKGPYADTLFKYIDATKVIKRYLARGYILGVEDSSED